MTEEWMHLLVRELESVASLEERYKLALERIKQVSDQDGMSCGDRYYEAMCEIDQIIKAALG